MAFRRRRMYGRGSIQAATPTNEAPFDPTLPVMAQVRCNGQLHKILYTAGKTGRLIFMNHPSMKSFIETVETAKILGDDSRYGCVRVLLAWNSMLGRNAQREKELMESWGTCAGMNHSRYNSANFGTVKLHELRNKLLKYQEITDPYIALPKDLQQIASHLQKEQRSNADQYHLRHRRGKPKERSRFNYKEHGDEKRKSLLARYLRPAMLECNLSKFIKWPENYPDNYTIGKIRFSSLWLSDARVYGKALLDGELVYQYFLKERGDCMDAASVLVRTESGQFRLALRAMDNPPTLGNLPKKPTASAKVETAVAAIVEVAATSTGSAPMPDWIKNLRGLKAPTGV